MLWTADVAEFRHGHRSDRDIRGRWLLLLTLSAIGALATLAFLHVDPREFIGPTLMWTLPHEPLHNNL